MVVSKHEAAQALSEIDTVRQRTESMQYYRGAAPHFVIWGGVWLLANSTTALYPALSNTAWPLLIFLGSVLSTWLGIRTGRRYAATMNSQPKHARKSGWQFGATWFAVIAYFIANFALLPDLDAKQGNAYISMFWAFLYTLMGIWTGWRILTVGILTAASILVGYFVITTHYFLWMGLVTGSLLMLGGLWLRKV